MALTKQDRQRIIDDYLSKSGRNMFVPAEFVDWLQGKPDHEAYEAFFGTTDAVAAREYRTQMARKMASGLRIVARQEEARKATVVSISVREYPAFVSPMAGRKSGGGYEPFDPDNAAHLAELVEQGRASLRGWLARYRGAFEEAGVDLSGIEKIAIADRDGVAQSA